MGDNEEIRLQWTTIIKHNQLDSLAIRNCGSKMRTQRGGPMELWWEDHELSWAHPVSHWRLPSSWKTVLKWVSLEQWPPETLIMGLRTMKTGNSLRKVNIAMNNCPFGSMMSLSNMVIFHTLRSYVEVPKEYTRIETRVGMQVPVTSRPRMRLFVCHFCCISCMAAICALSDSCWCLVGPFFLPMGRELPDSVLR